jgi:solute carrier family 25 S-adenosylmethionine transporter 26
VGSAPGAALFFVTYDGINSYLTRRRAQGAFSGSDGTWPRLSEPVEHMIAASLGEIMACAVRVPTEVIKQRTQALQHASSLATLKHILAQRETLGLGAVWSQLYRGWSVTVMREIPFTVIQFPLWEGMKKFRRDMTGLSQVNPIESALFGSAAGAVAAAATTPLDVVKTRIMLADEKKLHISKLLSDIYKNKGPKAFFAGLGPRVFWISAGGAIFLGSYEWVSNFLRSDEKELVR